MTSSLDFIPFGSVLWGSQAEKPPSPSPVSAPRHSSVCVCCFLSELTAPSASSASLCPDGVPVIISPDILLLFFQKCTGCPRFCVVLYKLFLVSAFCESPPGALMDSDRLDNEMRQVFECSQCQSFCSQPWCVSPTP